MVYSKSAAKLRELIEKAIEDHIITRAEYDSIMAIALEDGHIDKHEQSLLNQLQEMIEDKSVKIIP
jgi:hypothetical protein